MQTIVNNNLNGNDEHNAKNNINHAHNIKMLFNEQQYIKCHTK